MRSNDIIVGVLIAGALVYNQLARASNHTLLALIAITVLAAGVYAYMYIGTNNNQKVDKQITLEKEGRPGRVETAIPGAKTITLSFPKKGFRYIKENATFVDIVQDIRILKVFDKARFADIILLLDRLQKIYIYILAGRYEPVSYMGSFMDTREAVLEQFYALAFTLPLNLKHTYGVNPQDLVKGNIEKITAVTRTMADVLQSYAKKTAGIPHVPSVVESPAPHDPFDPMNQLRLP